MKTSYKFASAALIAALGLGVAVASETKATETANGRGRIEFNNVITEDTGGTILPPDTSEPILRPTDSGAIIPGTKERQFKYISSFDFDVHDVVATNSNAGDRTFNVDTYTQPKEDGTGTFTMPHFVRFRDYRSQDGVENFYTIKAQMTQDFTNGSSVLNSEVKVKEVQMGSSSNKLTMPDPAKHTNVTLKSGFELSMAKGSQEVLTNKESGIGFGVHEIMFGSYDKVNAAGEDGFYDSVQLVIPALTVVKQGEYNAVITWTIEDAA